MGSKKQNKWTKNQKRTKKCWEQTGGYYICFNSLDLSKKLGAHCIQLIAIMKLISPDLINILVNPCFSLLWLF